MCDTQRERNKTEYLNHYNSVMVFLTEEVMITLKILREKERDVWGGEGRDKEERIWYV